MNSAGKTVKLSRSIHLRNSRSCLPRRAGLLPVNWREQAIEDIDPVQNLILVLDLPLL